MHGLWLDWLWRLVCECAQDWTPRAHAPQWIDCPPRRSFFEDYKKNEHKEVIVDDFLGAEEAKKVLKDSLVGEMWCR
jgi:hypothetical protein